MTIEHLADIDRLVNESLHMLSRYDELNAKVLPLMEDYLIALRSRDKTPASLLRMDKQHEKELIDNYTTGIQQKIKGLIKHGDNRFRNTMKIGSLSNLAM